MTEYGFLISYQGRAWVTIEADSIEEARRNLLESSCSVDDDAFGTLLISILKLRKKMIKRIKRVPHD